MKDDVVIVTGGGRGIGRAICQRFGRQGARVVAVARQERELLETKDLVEEAGGTCVIHLLDVTAIEQLQCLIDCTEKAYGRIDVLVNNAGSAICAPAADVLSIEFETMMRVNVAAVFYSCKFAVPVMKRHGGGVIINISSMAAFDPYPGMGTYGAGKAWVCAFSRSLAAENKDDGIRVYCVAPGAVDTDMLRSACPDFPTGMTLAPGDIAETVYTLAQPAMAYAGGQTFLVRK